MASIRPWDLLVDIQLGRRVVLANNRRGCCVAVGIFEMYAALPRVCLLSQDSSQLLELRSRTFAIVLDKLHFMKSVLQSLQELQDRSMDSASDALENAV